MLKSRTNSDRSLPDLAVHKSLTQDRSKETLQKREDEEREAKEKKTEAQNEKKGLKKVKTIKMV